MLRKESGKKNALWHFKRADPHFYKATAVAHSSLPNVLPQKRTRVELFEKLVRIVISQQLGTHAARSISIRVKGLCGRITPQKILEVDPLQLRVAGLSEAKIKTIKEIAKTVSNGTLDLLALKKMAGEKASEKLMGIWGLGPWSVEMFMMNGLGRDDVFSAGDLGIVRSIESIYNLPRGVTHEKLLKISQKWSPYRTYACLLLWACRDFKKNVKIKGTKAD